jgi:hypothetical protein
MAKGEALRGHLELVYPSEYVKAADLKGRDVTVIIHDVTKENLVMVGGKKDRKAVVTMRARNKDGTPGQVLGKRWVVGKTVLRQIGASTKSNIIDEWIGREVTLYPTTCRGKEGKDVECIRVRVRVDQQANDVPDDMAAEPEPHADFVDEVGV